MSYYATGDIRLAFRAGAKIDDVERIIDEWEDSGFELDELTADYVQLTFNSKYKTDAVEAHLLQLAPFVEPGEYAQFVGENRDVWRIVFQEGDTLITKEARFL